MQTDFRHGLSLSQVKYRWFAARDSNEDAVESCSYPQCCEINVYTMLPVETKLSTYLSCQQ